MKPLAKKPKKKKQQWEAGWKCRACKLIRQENGGPDPCLGILPSVKYACCGHAGKSNCGGYVYFENGVIIRFKALTEIERIITHSPEGHIDLTERIFPE